MSDSPFWQSESGRVLLDKIVAKRIPRWPNGLKDGQREAVLRILDGEDLLWVAATGEGKSVALQVPAIVHNEILKNPDLYPGMPAKKDAVTLLVTPTKGLSQNIVTELESLGVTAFAYTHTNISQANVQKQDIMSEIKNCAFSVVCIDPEHLMKSDWSIISQFPKFRSNFISAGVEEAHLIDEWENSDFRSDFQHIGKFFRSKLPLSISVFALSATIMTGKSTDIICKNLGFQNPFFHHLLAQMNT